MRVSSKSQAPLGRRIDRILRGLGAALVVTVGVGGYALYVAMVVGLRTMHDNRDATWEEIRAVLPSSMLLVFVLFVVVGVVGAILIAVLSSLCRLGCRAVLGVCCGLVRVWRSIAERLPTAKELPHLPRSLWILSHLLPDLTRTRVFEPAYLIVAMAYERRRASRRRGERRLWAIVLYLRTAVLIAECAFHAAVAPVVRFVEWWRRG
jgi:hypothetical protein